MLVLTLMAPGNVF